MEKIDIGREYERPGHSQKVETDSQTGSEVIAKSDEYLQ